MVKIWIRLLYLEFINDDTGQVLTIGKTVDDSHKPKIEIKGSKYISSLKDNFTVKVYNMTYSEIYAIQKRQLFHIKIHAGYLNGQNYFDFEAPVVYDGYVINLLNSKKEYKDNVTTFIVTSKAVAKAQEFRLAISYQSGVNLYAMAKYIAEKAGLENSYISESFKSTFEEDLASCDASATTYLDQIANSGGTTYVTTDSTSDSDFSLLNLSEESRSRTTIIIDPSKGMLIGSAPEINSSGLTFDSLPVVTYLVGDLINIDNAYIDVTSGQDSYSTTIKTPNTVYLNAQGLYYIWQVDYSLSNTNGDFKVHLTCKNKELFDKVISSV